MDLATVFDRTADFLVSLWFKSDVRTDWLDDFSWAGSSLIFSEGASLVDMAFDSSTDARDWGIRLTTGGVSFGIGELDADLSTNIDSVLRSHAGKGKQFTWQVRPVLSNFLGLS